MAETEEQEIRSSWKVGSLCLIYSRSTKKWYDGKIETITVSDDDEKESQKLAAEWLIVRYCDNKKTKKIQRNCNDIKSIPLNHISALKKGSLCLIYSNIIDLWCRGEILSVFIDEEGEWLKVKYWDTNDHKICDIQRYSRDLKPFNNKLLYKPIMKILEPPKPWKLHLNTNNDILPNRFSNPVSISDTEFIIAPWHTVDMDDTERLNNGIYKYNIIKNEWKLWMLYPDNFLSEYHHTSINYDKQIIYLLYGYVGFEGGQIWKIDIKTEKFESFPLNFQCTGSLGYINSKSNKFSIFWGNKNNKHIIWNEQESKNEYDEDGDDKNSNIIHEWKDLEKGGMLSFGMIYNEKEEYFLLLGGFKGRGLGRSDEIWRYYINDNNKKWEKLKIKLPDKMQSFASIITSDCKYVLCLGGSDEDGLNDKIYILNLLNMKWKLSKLICTFRGAGINNVILTKLDNIEYIYLLQGKHAIFSVPVHDILSFGQ